MPCGGNPLSQAAGGHPCTTQSTAKSGLGFQNFIPKAQDAGPASAMMIIAAGRERHGIAQDAAAHHAPARSRCSPRGRTWRAPAPPESSHPRRWEQAPCRAACRGRTRGATTVRVVSGFVSAVPHACSSVCSAPAYAFSPSSSLNWRGFVESKLARVRGRVRRHLLKDDDGGVGEGEECEKGKVRYAR